MNDQVLAADEEEGGGGFLNHLPAILWQRRWLVVFSVVFFSAAGLAAAFLLPTTYRSSATLLVESQELPEELVGSPVTAIIDQRIAKIRQRVLSRGDLIDLIQQNALYEEERRSKSITEIVEKMRSSVKLDTLKADIAQSKGTSNTIAFTMSFDYEDPFKAQLVMQSFVDSFRELDSTDMADQAGSTVQFLTAQEKDLQSQISAMEGRITSIKARNGTALASAGFTAGGSSSTYDQQIAALQRENMLVSEAARAPQKDPVITQAEAQLATARALFKEGHPDIAMAQQRLQAAQKIAAANKNDNRASAAAAQIAANNAQISALARARAQDAARSSSVSAAQAQAPVVMEQIAQLETRLTVLRAQHQDVSTRLLNAKNSAKMETEDKGERLIVTDPPVVPEDPLSPNRPMLVAGGIAAGIFGGILLALIVEMILKPIRGVSSVERVTGAGPLVVIPTIKLAPPRSQRFFRFFSRFRRTKAQAAE